MPTDPRYDPRALQWNPTFRNGPGQGQGQQGQQQQIPPGFENMNFQSYDAFLYWLKNQFGPRQMQGQGALQQQGQGPSAVQNILGMLTGGGRG